MDFLKIFSALNPLRRSSCISRIQIPQFEYLSLGLESKCLAVLFLGLGYVYL